MKIQCISYLLGLILCAAPVVYAQEADTPAVHEAETEKQRANRLSSEANVMREQAQATYLLEEQECYTKFLVNHCINQAKQKRLETITEAREKESEARRLQLEEKRRGVEEAEAKKASKPAVESESGTGQTVETTDPVVEPTPESEQIRAERAANARQAEAVARRQRQYEDQARAQKRAVAEAEAATRAKQAEEDRRRYDDRIRQHEEDQKKEN